MDRRPIAGRRPRRAATQKRGSYGEKEGLVCFSLGIEKNKLEHQKKIKTNTKK
jgi:hypothetical protein